jgi:hypothetical protein
MIGKTIFGGGRIYATDANGATKEIGEVKDVSVEFVQSVKELTAGKQYTLAAAIEKREVSGKIGVVTINNDQAAAFIGGTVTAGSKADVTETISSGTTFTPANSANFDADLGVTDAAGKPFTKVASAPTVGQYAVNATTGIVTLSAGQTFPLLYTYRYKRPATGSTLTSNNASQVAVTTHVLRLGADYSGAFETFSIFAAYFPKYALGFKAGEFKDIGLDFKGIADSTGKVFEYTYE